MIIIFNIRISFGNLYQNYGEVIDDDVICLHINIYLLLLVLIFNHTPMILDMATTLVWLLKYLLQMIMWKLQPES